MKVLLLKLAAAMKFFKPAIKFVLKNKKEDIARIINDKYNNKELTEEEEQVLIEKKIDGIVDLL